jgi:signal transduction histidine kinase
VKGGRDILIVEDENIVALDMRMRLEAMGYRVVDVVETGGLAIERAAALTPDLVLMDIKLKGEQDGIEAAGHLRERTEVPVIFVTAFTDERTLERAKHASPYGYIVKPFHERELRIAIELALYKHQYELSIRRARDIAEEANRVKGEFLANMSHELKTPLNSVIGFTELAMSVSKEPEQGEYLAMALSSARSLLTLIDSILDFARMEAGKLSVVSAPFSLDEVLGECADSLAMGAFAKGLEVNLRRDPAIPDALVGDRSLLKHILLNLLDNAVKFTERGRIRLGAALYEQPSCAGCGPTVEFEVADTGIGMPRDKIDFAFARFTQLDPSRTRKAGGTGLGLAIVAKSVELMRGGLSVESDEGRGTRFSLRLTFDLGVEPSPPKDLPGFGRGVAEATIAGFDAEGFEDASLVLKRLGIAARRAERLENVVALSDSLVIADERAAAEADDAVLEALDSRLVVGTRFGTKVRSRLESRAGIAFTVLPLRADGLRDAMVALSRAPAEGRGRRVAAGSPDEGSAREAIIADQRKIADDARMARRFSAAEAAGNGFLRRLAESIEDALAAGSFAEAERAAKGAQGALAEAGDGTGSRLAFSALLLARKGDAPGLKDAASRMRAASTGEGEEG